MKTWSSVFCSLKKEILVLFLILVAGVNFGLLFSVNKIASEGGIPFFSYVFWYALGAGVILLPVAIFRGELPSTKGAHLKAYGVAPKLPSGVAVLLVILTPAFTYLFSLIARLEKFHVLSSIGIILGIVGVLLVVIPSGSLPESDMSMWFLLALLAPVCFAGLNVYAELSRPPEASSLSLAVGILFSSTLMLLPLMIGTGQIYLPPGSNLEADLALLGAVLINVIMILINICFIRYNIILYILL